MAAKRMTVQKLIERRWIWAALLFLLGIALVFGPCWTASALFRSEDSILRLPLLSNWRNLLIIFSQEFMIFSDGLYRPFSYAVIAVLRSIAPADSAGFWHSLLIAVHALNALLVFLLVRRFVRHAGAAILAAAVFCFHPLTAAVVNDINRFHILLGACFYLCSLLLYVIFRRGKRLLALAFSLFAFALGLLTSSLVITLPLTLIAYELAYERQRPRHLAGCLLPFVTLSSLAILLWSRLSANPVSYAYPVAQGDGWRSFFSIVAGARWYAQGLIWGRWVPAILQGLVDKISTWRNGGFLCWAAVLLLLLFIALWRMARRDFLGFGLFLIPVTLLPFASTAWNPVEEYASWTYLYAPLAGLACVMGALADRALRLRRSRWRAAALAALLLLVGQYAYRLCRIEYAARSPLAYWQYVAALSPGSEAAQVALGKAYLAENNLNAAMKHLFGPEITNLTSSCRAMCDYYLRQGDLLAASVHAAFADDPLTSSAVFRALDAPDHAEAALGVALAKNPFDTRAMKRLAEVFALKGYVPDASRWLDHAHEIDPSDTEAQSLLVMLEADDLTPYVAKPARADWIRFMVDRVSSRRLREEMVRLSESLPDDPAAQMRAGVCLLTDGDAASALDKFAGAYSRLSSISGLAVAFSWQLTLSGDAAAGLSVAHEALKRDPRNPKLLCALGLAAAKLGNLEEATAHFSEALEIDPDMALAHQQMGIALADQGRLEEAVQCFRRVVELKPDLAEAHMALAKVFAGLGKSDKAAEHFSRAMQVKLKDPKTHRESAVASYLKGDYEGAWEHVRECRRLGGWIHPDFLKALRSKMPEPER